MRARRGSLEGSGQATGKSDPEVQCTVGGTWVRRAPCKQGSAGGRAVG